MLAAVHLAAVLRLTNALDELVVGEVERSVLVACAGFGPHDGAGADERQFDAIVARTVSARDRRARELTITDLGRTTLESLGAVVRGLQPAILTGLDPAEQAEFLRLAAKAAEAGNSLSRAPLTVPPGLGPATD